MKPTIIVVDNDLAILDQFNDGLCDSYHVILVKNGSEAREWFDIGLGDLVITEVQSRCDNGLTMIEHVKSFDSSVPVIAFGNVRGQGEDRTVTDERSADVYTDKPIAMPYMRETIRTLIERSKRKSPQESYLLGRNESPN